MSREKSKGEDDLNEVRMDPMVVVVLLALIASTFLVLFARVTRRLMFGPWRPRTPEERRELDRQRGFR